VAFFLRKRGYKAYAIKGGLDAWREAGYPVEEKED
jgi:rhodanese-related sulfurtransferase